MHPELFSTARPGRLRLAGFLCLAAGAVLAGVGATRTWATVGFADDALGAADLPIHGTDVWEGKVVLFGAAAALLLMLGTRLAASSATRRGFSVLLILIGAACVVIPALDAARAEERFGGAEGVDRMAERLAAELKLPEDVVREQLKEELRRGLRVEAEPAAWVSAAGGLLLMTGGVLVSAWASPRRGRAPSDDESSAPGMPGGS